MSVFLIVQYIGTELPAGIIESNQFYSKFTSN
jgi:hypothetical protein